MSTKSVPPGIGPYKVTLQGNALSDSAGFTPLGLTTWNFPVRVSADRMLVHWIKALAAESNNLSLTSETHTVEEENRVLPGFLWHPFITYTLTHEKKIKLINAITNFTKRELSNRDETLR